MLYCGSLLRPSPSEQTPFFTILGPSTKWQTSARLSDCERRSSECARWGLLFCSSSAVTAEPNILSGEDRSDTGLFYVSEAWNRANLFLNEITTPPSTSPPLSLPDISNGEPCSSLIPVQKKEQNKLTHTRNVIICSGFQARKVIKKSSFTEQKERKFISRQILLIF